VIIHDVKQGTEEWLRLRAGIPTASEFKNLVTPAWKIKTGKAVDTYFYKKLAEKWRGSPLPSWGGGVLEQGSLREAEAIPYYEILSSRRVRRVGFLTTDDGRVGCSPDGLFDDGSGIEVKCPMPHTHVGYLMSGEVPDEYLPQIQGALYVTGADRWVFMSYCPEFPPFIAECRPVAAAQKALRQALAAFCERLEAGYQRLKDLYGQTPPCEEDEVLGF